MRPRYNLGPQGYVPVVRGGGSSGSSNGCGGSSGGGGVQDANPAVVSKEATAAATAAGGAGAQSGDREVCAMKWGLVPSFAKSPAEYDVFKGGRSTFNARIEGLDSSGLWQRLVDRQRGIVLLDGFYEWMDTGKSKVPMFFRNRDGYDGHAIRSALEEPCVLAQKSEDSSEDVSLDGPSHAPLMLAALYDSWLPKEGGKGAEDAQECLESVTIVTMDSDGTPVAKVHERMPVFLSADSAAMWLDSSASFGKVVAPVVRAAHEHARQQLLCYEVSTLVSSVKSESPDCILPKKDYDAKQFSRGLGKFFAKKTPQQLQSVSPQPTEAKRKAADDGDASAPPPSSKKAATTPEGWADVAGVTIILDD